MFELLKFPKVAAPLCAAMLLLIGCSQADPGAARTQIPSPGSDHLSQVYIMADRQNPGDLALSLLASTDSAVPAAKVYVERPDFEPVAEDLLRSWSARRMDWLLISGPLATQAFLKSQISWTNTKYVLLMAAPPAVALAPALAQKVVFLNPNEGVFEKWAADYCRSSKSWPECEGAASKKLFAWSHAELAAESLLKVQWSWPHFLGAAMKGPRRIFQFSFHDGFLTLQLQPSARSDAALKKRLETWVRKQALAGLSTQ